MSYRINIVIPNELSARLRNNAEFRYYMSIEVPEECLRIKINDIEIKDILKYWEYKRLSFTHNDLLMIDLEKEINIGHEVILKSVEFKSLSDYVKYSYKRFKLSEDGYIIQFNIINKEVK